MSMQAAVQPVRKTITVEVPIERAFDVFTNGHDSWWPRSHHIGKVEMAKAVLEPRTGGRYYEIGVDGSECEWGRVLLCEPPDRIVVSWHLDGNFQWDPDPEHASEWEVRFTSEGPSTTRVDLEHRHFERHGDGADRVRAGVDSPDGWGGTMKLFKEAAER